MARLAYPEGKLLYEAFDAKEGSALFWERCLHAAHGGARHAPWHAPLVLAIIIIRDAL